MLLLLLQTHGTKTHAACRGYWIRAQDLIRVVWCWFCSVVPSQRTCCTTNRRWRTMWMTGRPNKWPTNATARQQNWTPLIDLWSVERRVQSPEGKKPQSEDKLQSGLTPPTSSMSAFGTAGRSDSSQLFTKYLQDFFVIHIFSTKARGRFRGLGWKIKKNTLNPHFQWKQDECLWNGWRRLTGGGKNGPNCCI